MKLKNPLGPLSQQPYVQQSAPPQQQAQQQATQQQYAQHQQSGLVAAVSAQQQITHNLKENPRFHKRDPVNSLKLCLYWTSCNLLL